MKPGSRPFARSGPNAPVRLPLHARGMRIGLFGGSFNPPHAGHALVAEKALNTLGLDKLWWMVTPGNPLKNNNYLPSLATRTAWCRALARDPRIVVTGFEAEIGTRFSFDTLAYLQRRCPGVRFVWIMGADSLAGFHRWQKWQQIARMLPIAVIDRPGATLRAATAKAAQVFDHARIAESQAATLPRRYAPAWVFLHGPRSPLSSTAIRQQAARNATVSSN